MQTLAPSLHDVLFTPKPVKTKKDFVRRYQQGEFGNASPTWNTLEDFTKGTSKNKHKLYHLRNRVAGGVTYYNLYWYQIFIRWGGVKDPGQWYVSEMAPHDKTLLQGEIKQATMGEGRYGLELFYSTIKKPMREALAEKSEFCFGIRALQMLQYTLCPNSLTWIQELLKLYPGHVIEFSTFDTYWGTVPHHNTVIWEVRLY